MARMRITTYKDMIDHLVDYLGGSTSEETERYARRAIQAAYNEVATGHRWRYYLTRGRIVTAEPQTSSTITYDHTGGTYERMVTIASGTWPSWAAYGVLVISNVAYEVAERKSSTVITLAPSSNPGEDVAAGTSYTLYRDTYPLPIDFVEVGEIINVGTSQTIAIQSPQEWLSAQRSSVSTAQPAFCTISGDPNYFGIMALRLYPAPDDAYNLDFIYHRRPRQLNLAQYSTGSASTTSGLTTLTGSGTTFTSSMVGSLIRFGTQGGTDIPTGPGGTSPSTVERVLTGYTSGTSMTLDADPAATLTGVKFSVSDPVDIEEGAMLTFFLRECEKQLRDLKRMAPTSTEERHYQEAWFKARETDSRNFSPRAAGKAYTYYPDIRNMPRGADVS